MSKSSEIPGSQNSFKGAWLAAYYALQRHIPFSLYILPGKKRPNFICDLEGRPSKSAKTFSIVPWSGTFCDRVIIRDTISASDFLTKLPAGNPEAEPEYFPWNESTEKLIYKGQIINAIDILDNLGAGKIVLSRVIVEKNAPEIDYAYAYVYALMHLSNFCPETLKYLYYTPETGCWLAATPELLLNYDKSGCDFSHTMALAGTRRRGYTKTELAWDAKNQYEHDIVAEVILDTLQKLGVNTIEERENLVKTGNVEHLCHDIRFRAADVAPELILDSLSPTPALGGFPREVALKFIDNYELHPRRCYGGYVAIDDEKQLLTYVNLRCANLWKETVCIYAGGGITSQSKPDEEWKETDLKAQTLRSFLMFGFNSANLKEKES